MKTDRSGRTLKEYRQLYWDGKERIKELEAKLDAVKDARDEYFADPWVYVSRAEVYARIDEAIGEQE